MTCERYADTDAAERYVGGAMTREEEAEFELHILGCEPCLATVSAVEDIRDALVADRPARRAALAAASASAAAGPAQTEENTSASVVRPEAFEAARRARKRRLRLAAVAVAASALVAVFWGRTQAPSSDDVPVPPDSTVARDNAADGERRRPPAPTTPPAPSAGPSTTTSPSPGATTPVRPNRLEQIARLAVVVPPPYVSVPVRSETDAPRAQAFAAAMARYRARDYNGAAEGLRALVRTAPDVAVAQFYLGVSELMLKQPERAEEALRRAAGSGATLFADEAHFYLAKAALQRNDLATARRELARAVELDAGPGDQARTLLQQLRTIAPAR